ncbi:uncharacterized protein K452DRAFT_46695 [Aplosporella prunicola CBS 121167]|uniref:Uncharacterized protein n=1 Tax=Aplosporella prunicola CBS 121167 TaxID=1176127 RepID=A0A6A6BD84_9PEZI|nr:uncharacterized protein K452DRAFT_46695 [Aplosporella prunicola CBS 121167]KAF2140441.1 hypothetical protein K452DRAFT_46695 [Aplosporella prunicola CBS 121167]
MEGAIPTRALLVRNHVGPSTVGKSNQEVLAENPNVLLLSAHEPPEPRETNFDQGRCAGDTNGTRSKSHVPISGARWAPRPAGTVGLRPLGPGAASWARRNFWCQCAGRWSMPDRRCHGLGVVQGFARGLRPGLSSIVPIAAHDHGLTKRHAQ